MLERARFACLRMMNSLRGNYRDLLTQTLEHHPIFALWGLWYHYMVKLLKCY